MIFRRPFLDDAVRLMPKQVSATSHEKPRVAFFWGGRGKCSAFKALPGAAVLVTVGALGLQALGAATAEKLPVLESIGPASIQGRRYRRAGITGFGAFSHSLTEPQARLTPVIRGTTGDWINPRGRVAAAEYSLTQSKAAARRRCAAITAHPDRQNQPPAPPPKQAPWPVMSPACCPP